MCIASQKPEMSADPFSKISGGTRLQKPDDNGRNVSVFVTRLTESRPKDANGKEYPTTMANSFFLSGVELLHETRKRDKNFVYPPPKEFPAFTTSNYLKMFNTPNIGFKPMCFYNAVGVCRSSFKDKNSGEPRESLAVAQLREIKGKYVREQLLNIPFDNRRFHPQRDAPENGEITETGAFVIELKNISEINPELTSSSRDLEWFKDQPAGTFWAFCKAASTDFRCGVRFGDKKENEDKGVPFEDAIVGKSSGDEGDPFHLHARQVDLEGNAITIDINMRLGDNTTNYFRSAHWQQIGYCLLGSLEGLIIGSTNVKGTKQLKNPDENTFHHFIQMNGEMVPQVANMIRKSGFKVTRKVGLALANHYAPPTKLPHIPNFGSTPTEAYNLTCEEIPEETLAELMDDSKYDYYIAGNWYSQQRKHINEYAPEEEEALIAALTSEDGGLFWTQGESPMVDVFAVPNDEQTTNKRMKVSEED
jgi:hypothetical protein